MSEISVLTRYRELMVDLSAQNDRLGIARLAAQLLRELHRLPDESLEEIARLQLLPCGVPEVDAVAAGTLRLELRRRGLTEPDWLDWHYRLIPIEGVGVGL